MATSTLQTPVDTILQGDCLEVLSSLPAESVQCCITSPPYYNLRDYGTAKWVGGNTGCDHREVRGSTRGGPASTLSGGQDLTPHATQYRQQCGKCGASRQDAQIGMEKTAEAYIQKMVEVFREVRRVLRRDGVLWLNLGDSFGKGKQLQGIPWRVALALQADGWVLRSDCIWSKPNCMPSSVRDRPTSSHEYLFLLAKSEQYFYDAEAIKDPATFAGAKIKITPKSLSLGQAKGAGVKPSGNATKPFVIVAAGRNKRTVWTIATHSYAGAHFATFPPALVEPCILAGSSPQACEVCGAPWERVTEHQPIMRPRPDTDTRVRNIGGRTDGLTKMPNGIAGVNTITTGWQPTCRCDNSGDGRCVVLDPFAGAGTVAVVAQQYGRHYLGIELNPSYIHLAEERIATGIPAKKRQKSNVIALSSKRPIRRDVEQLELFA